MKKIIFAFLCFYITCNAQQDLKSNYTPLKSKGELPAVFTQNIRNVIKQDITDLKNKKESDKWLKSTFLTASNYQIERIVRSGNTLINDEITAYLNKIVDVVLKDNPNLRKQLNVFTLKSSVVNAYSFDKGYVFIDIGLVAQAETEAQLAYIICHEISHYTKQHHINSYVKNAEIDRHGYGYSTEQRIIEKCQYSKESESEADIEGLKLYERTLYNLKQAEKAFDMLQYAHLPFELVPFKKTYFETPNYILPKGYFLNEVSAIKDNSDEDDTKQTHPNTKKRKQAIGEIISNRDNTNRVNAIVGQEKFEYIRDLSRMEICRLYLKSRDYPNALYAAYIMSLKYPSNEYLAEIISKCMYAITLFDKGEISYNSDSNLENGFSSYTNVESYPQQLYYLISKMPENEWTIMSMNYVYRQHKKYPNNKELTIYSDSMFSLMKRTRWGINDFARIIKKEVPKSDSTQVTKEVEKEPGSKTELIASFLQKEREGKSDDTIYYRNAFVDLFTSDREFSEKFPTSGSSETSSGSDYKTYSFSSSSSSSNSYTKKKSSKNNVKIQKVLLLEPAFLKFDETKREEIQYITSDKKQEDYSKTINDCAKLLEVELITIDPGLLTAAEVDKINDYSVINDWFDEKFDTDREKNKILNTDDVDGIIKKYGTPYILKTGIVTVITRSSKKRTYFYGFLYDIKKNELVYKRYEFFKSKDRQDLVNAKTYQMLYELRNPAKK